jgi:hypothetical protein
MVWVVQVQARTWDLELVEVRAASRCRSRRHNRELGDCSVLSELSSVGGARQPDAVSVNAGWMIEFVDEADDHRIVDVESHVGPGIVPLNVMSLRAP